MKRSFLFILCLCFSKLLFAALTVNTTIADCNTPGSMTLSSTIGIVDSFSYSGRNNGTVIGNTVMLNAGIYSVTATLSNGSTETLANVIVDHNDHIQLKNWYLTGNIPSTSVNWGISLNDPLMSNWSGITKNGNGCVSSVLLQNCGISGTIPNFSLSNLAYLDLSDNELTGSIPNFNLLDLKEINLSYNFYLSGSIPNFNLPNLEVLKIEYADLNGSIPNFNLPNLRELNISLNYNIVGAIPNFNLPNLKKIKLSGNNLQGTIPNFNLPNLETLDLNSNELTGSIPNFNLTNLTYLNLAGNKLTGTIPSFNMLDLAILFLSNNQLTGVVPNFNFTKSYMLDLGNNQLTGTIPSFNYPDLIFLNLEGNQLTGTIPSFNLPKLNRLELNNNFLTGNIPTFSYCKLNKLDLSNNQLSGNIPTFESHNLYYLYLNDNQLSGCIPYQIKYNNIFLSATNGNISNNPNLNTQSWEDYWNNNAGICPGVILSAKLFLSSVDASTQLMSDSYRKLSSFPLTDPYSTPPYNNSFVHVNNPTVAQTTSAVLSKSGNNAIVDWVFLELRQGVSGATSVVSTKSALLQRDGEIVGMNGVSPVVFDNIPVGNYYVAVRHRNHIGCRTSIAYTFNLTPISINFAQKLIPLHGIFPLNQINQNTYSLNGGDANSDGSIDSLDTILWESQNGLFNDYTLNSDYNMDGSVDALDSIFWELNNGKFQELD